MPKKKIDLEIGPVTMQPEQGLDIGPVMRPEAAQYYQRFIDAGLPPGAAQAALQQMGLLQLDPEQDAWDAYSKQHPYAANTKKLLVTAGRGVKDAMAPIVNPVKVDNEKAAAHAMLKEYLHAQDAEKANQIAKQGLWNSVAGMRSNYDWQSGVAPMSSGTNPQESWRFNGIMARNSQIQQAEEMGQPIPQMAQLNQLPPGQPIGVGRGRGGATR